MDAGITEYRFKWLLENYADIEKYPLRARFQSPEFYTKELERTSWFLYLEPSESSIYLQRDEGPVNIPIKFEVTITTEDGSSVYSEKSEHNFSYDTPRFFCTLKDLDVRRNALVVRCKMWRGEGTVEKVTQCVARSRVVLEKISFFLQVDNFSTRKINKMNTLKEIRSFCKTGLSFFAFLEISERDHESITIVTEYRHSRSFWFETTLWLIDASGNEIEFAVDPDNSKDKLPTLTRRFILRNRKKYLPNDELTLMCELIFPYDVHKTEETLYDIPIATYLDKYRDAFENN